jgi:Cu/Ag efflux pump CusA
MHSYQYNNLNRLTALSVSNAASEILNAFNYQLNAVGHRTRVEEASGQYQDQMIFSVAVWGEEKLRTDIQALRRLPIEIAGGTLVPLGDVADIEVVPAPNRIVRESVSRRIDVTCNVRGRDLGSVAQEIDDRIAGVPFELGYHPEILGEYAERKAASRQLYLMAILSLIGIFVLLQVDFQSFRLVLMVGLTLPFALIGGVVAAFLGGGVLSIGSLVGFVTVLGIAARNGIMLVSHFRHLEQEEGMQFGVPLVLRGAEERLAPILMTASSAALALLPLVIAGNIPGHEIEFPMAVVILGGLVTSTALNLLVLPVLYAAFGRRVATSV